MPALLLTLLLSGAALGAEPGYATRCPEDTRPVRTVDPLKPWACVLTDERYREGVRCPSGYEPVTTADAYDPFKCAASGLVLQAPKGVCPPGHRPAPTADPDRDYECERVGKSFADGPSCPKGTRPVPTPGSLSPFKCVTGFSSDPEPLASPEWKEPASAGAKPGACPKGTRRARSENPFAPLQCVPVSAERAPDGFKRYTVPGEIAFDYPLRWRVTDDWRDETPTVFIMLDAQRDGKPVSLTVSRQRRSSRSFQPMDAMILREKDWHGAREERGRKVAGREAVSLAVPEESNTSFLPLPDGYIVVSYSAPADLHARFLPAYERLLSSLRLLDEGRSIRQPRKAAEGRGK